MLESVLILKSFPKGMQNIRNVWLCNSGTTLWLGGTTSLIGLYRVFLDVCFSDGKECQDVLNVLSFRRILRVLLN